jgi:hypothetical protein
MALYSTEPDGVVACLKHMVELLAEPIEVVSPDLRECALCTTKYVEGNRCAREACNKPLHPNWPAVYCSNACAHKDA